MTNATFRHSMCVTIAAVALSGTPSAAAEKPVNCAGGQSLAKALEHANPGDIFRLSGTCQERVRVTTDRVVVDGQGLTVLDGGGGGPLEFSAVVMIDGAQGVVVKGLTVQNGPGEGILGIRGSAFTLSDVRVEHNASAGIAVADGSTATLIDCTTRQNRIGLDVFTTSAAVMKGTIRITDNTGNGADVSGRSILELRGAAVQVSENGGFGLTVGGSQLAIFGFTESQGSTLMIKGNTLAGLVIATGSLEVLASSPAATGANVITSSNNGTDGIWLPARGAIISPFGAAKFVIHGNTVGLKFENDSNAVIVGGLDVGGNQAGLLADAAGALTLVSIPPNPSSILGNGLDVGLSFGTRATFDGPAVFSIRCDSTVLARGSTVCPSPMQ
jgi:Right handed beta helix region